MAMREGGAGAVSPPVTGTATNPAAQPGNAARLAFPSQPPTPAGSDVRRGLFVAVAACPTCRGHFIPRWAGDVRCDTCVQIRPARKYERWTRDYVEVIRRELQRVPAKVLAHRLGIEEPALRMRLSRYGISTIPRDAEGLPPRRSLIVSMRREGKSVRQIAEALSLAEGGVGRQLHLARKQGVAI
jgi:hypothetical protein